MSQRPVGVVSAVVLLLISLWPGLVASQTPRSLAEPSLSPDASEIAFVSGGDIWVVNTGGGEARLLVSHPADDMRPLWSPDGRQLAFLSDRAGDVDIYVLDLEAGQVRRLTYADVGEELTAWSADGEWIYFSSAVHDVLGFPDVLRVRANGGTPMPVSADAYSEEFSANPSPDGQRLVVAARGRQSMGQWWRNGHSHIDESELWLVRDGTTPSYQLLTAGGKNLWPRWADGGRAVVFMSDRSGAENLWRVEVGPEGPASEPRPLTRYTDGRVLFPSASRDGRTVAFERDFSIWTVAADGGEPHRVPITLRGAVQTGEPERLSLNTGFSGLALSPDAKKIAFVMRGEVFAASAEDGGPANRVTRTVESESAVEWASDSRRVVYISRREGRPSVWLHDFATGQELRVTSGGDDASPSLSPDGKKLAYVRGGAELRLVDLESGSDSRITAARLWRPPYEGALEWSPDGRWLAWMGEDDQGFTNVHVVEVDGGEPRQVTRLANAFGNSLAWHPSGRSLFFATGQRTEEWRVARVDLVPRTPRFREDRFFDLFDSPEPQSDAGAGEERVAESADDSSAVVIDLEGIGRRVEILPIGLDVDGFVLSPDGKTLVLTASAEGQTNLYAYSVDEEADEPPVARQLTSTPGGKGSLAFTPDGRRVFFLDRGRIASLTVADGRTENVTVTTEIDVDFDESKVAAFDEAWTYLRDHFYDADLHGADWNGVRQTFAPRIDAAGSQGELRRLMNLMIGELNGSHLGYTAPIAADAPTESTARLGLQFDRDAYEDDGVFLIDAIVPLGATDVVAGIDIGDRLVALDGRQLDGTSNIDELLVNRAGERVRLAVLGPGDDAPHDVYVQPMSPATERELVYRRWVDDRRAYVDRVSRGRLGYVHMPDMSEQSLLRLIHDLDADNHARDGVVVDIRNNTGGFVHAYALDIFARRGFLTMEQRGTPEFNARTQLGQRSLEVPTVLVVNQNTLSDGEDFTEGYRALGLGTIVGEPTAGWIIYTGVLSLVNGGSIRMPSTKIRGADGEVMERNPRQVDVLVERPLGESYLRRDSQLDEAIRVLLGQLDGGAVRVGREAAAGAR